MENNYDTAGVFLYPMNTINSKLHEFFLKNANLSINIFGLNSYHTIRSHCANLSTEISRNITVNHSVPQGI